VQVSRPKPHIVSRRAGRSPGKALLVQKPHLRFLSVTVHRLVRKLVMLEHDIVVIGAEVRIFSCRERNFESHSLQGRRCG